MPTFDFRCSSCGHVFEFSRPFGSDVIPPCPKCQHTETEKLIAPPAIQFKGTGFYKTDTGKKTSAPKKDQAAGTDTPPTPETKPAPKPNDTSDTPKSTS